MLLSGPTRVDEIIVAIKELGGEASAKLIKDRVTHNRGGRPPQYGSDHSYRETIQRLIEDLCPQSDNFRREPHFLKLRRGYYRFLTPA